MIYTDTLFFIPKIQGGISVSQSHIIHSLEKEKEKKSDQHISAMDKGYRALRRGAWMASALIADVAYDHIPNYRSGNLLGHWSQMTREDGAGLNDVIEEAAKLAAKHPSGMCQFRIGPKFALLITDPKLIHDVMYKLNDCMHGNDSLGIFTLIFGKDNIFDLPISNPKWKIQRDFFVSRLLAPKALEKAAPRMQEIIRKNLPIDSKGIPDVPAFTKHLAIDIVSKTELGITDITDSEKQELSDIISQTVVKLTNPILIYLPGFTKIRKEFDALRERGKILITKILQRNKDNILNTDNALTAWMKLSKKEFDSEEVLHMAGTFLIVGHETTATFLQFMIMLLADPKHKEVIDKVRQEILAAGFDTKKIWSKKEIDSLPYLQKMMRKALDLYPPVPIFKEEVHKDCELNGMPLYAGTILFMSAFVTHRLKGLDFNPDLALHENNHSPSFMPFGFKPRTCPGRLFSMLEGGLLAAYLVSNFNMIGNVSHPFKTINVFNLRLVEDKVAKIDLTPWKPELQENSELQPMIRARL